MTLEELKQCEHGTEIVGLPLVIKTARDTYIDGDEQAWQDVVFMDASGEMEGSVLLPEYTPVMDGTKNDNRPKVPPKVWRSKGRIFVVRGEIQEADIRRKMGRKLAVFEGRDMAVRLSYDQYNDLAEAEGKDWLEARKEEIRGKIRHGLACAMIQREGLQTPGALTKKAINEWVKFIETGE